MKTFNVRAMVEGAIFAAVTVIMGIFYNVPVLNTITLFWPVPIIILGYRHGFRISIISTAVAAVIISLAVNPLVGLTLLMVYALPGSIMGMILHRGKSSYAAIFVGGLLLAVTAVLEFALMLHVLSDKNIFDIVLNFGQEIQLYYNNIYETTVKSVELYSSLGVDQETIEQVLEMVKTFISTAEVLMPVFFIFTGVFTAYINFKVVGVILNRMGYYIEDIKPFYTWRVKNSFVIPVFMLTAAILLINYFKISWMQSLAMNLLTAMSMAYGVLGLSVVVYFLRKAGKAYDIPKPLQTFILVILVVFLYAILPFIGMYDLTADIRRLNRDTTGGVK